MTSRIINKILIMTFSAIAVAITANARTVYLSPTALAIDKEGKTLYVAEATAKQVSIVDLVSGKVTKNVRVSDEPSGIAIAPDGSVLYVSIAAPEGLVDIVKLSKGKVTDRSPPQAKPFCRDHWR